MHCILSSRRIYKTSFNSKPSWHRNLANFSKLYIHREINTQNNLTLLTHLLEWITYLVFRDVSQANFPWSPGGQRLQRSSLWTFQDCWSHGWQVLSSCPWPYTSVEVPDGGQHRELQRTDMAVWQRVSMALHSTPRFILPALHPSVSTCDSAHATSSTSLIIPHRHCWQRTPVFPWQPSGLPSPTMSCIHQFLFLDLSLTSFCAVD